MQMQATGSCSVLCQSSSMGDGIEAGRQQGLLHLLSQHVSASWLLLSNKLFFHVHLVSRIFKNFFPDANPVSDM